MRLAGSRSIDYASQMDALSFKQKRAIEAQKSLYNKIKSRGGIKALN